MPTLYDRIVFMRDEAKDWEIYASSTFTSGAPATKVQHSRPAVYARSTDTSSGTPAYVRFDSGSADAVDPDDYLIWMGYIRHDGTAGTLEYRVRVSDNSDLTSPTYDSGSGGIAIASPWSNRSFAHAADNPLDSGTSLNGRYVGVDFWATGASYIDIGRIMIGKPWQPPINAQYGSSLPTPSESTIRVRGSRGQEFSAPSKVYMEVNGRILFETESDAKESWMDLTHRVGTNSDVLFMQSGTDTTYAQQGYVYGRFDTLAPVNIPAYSLYGVSYKIEEIR